MKSYKKLFSNLNWRMILNFNYTAEFMFSNEHSFPKKSTTLKEKVFKYQSNQSIQSK